MPLITYDSLESVPDDFKSIAKEVEGGKVQINVVPKATVDQFRDTNIQLKKDHDAALQQLAPLKEIVGESPDEFRKSLEELRAINQRVKDGELKETRAIEEALGKRTDEMRKDYERQLQAKGSDAVAWKTKFEQMDGAYRRERVATAIKDAAMDPESGVNPAAIEELINSGHAVFSITDDGKLAAMDGSSPIYGSDGSNYMTPKEWLGKMRERKPFFFKTSQGGGAGGEQSVKGTLGIDPKVFAKMTPQQKLAAANEARFKQTGR